MYRMSLICSTKEFPQKNDWKYSFCSRRERSSALDEEISRHLIWKILQEKFQGFFFFFYLISSLNDFICIFLFLQGVLSFTLTSYLLLIILSFNPFPIVYLLTLWPPNPLNSTVLFLILIGEGKIGFVVEFSNRVLLWQWGR